MNIFSIIEQLEKVDPELNDRFNPRRAAIKNITSFGSKVAVAAMPFALGTLFKRAYGQTAGDPVSVLNFALKLEYLEAEFYNIGVGTAGLIPTGIGMTALSTIRDHENSHVAFLQKTIVALGGVAVTRASQGFGAGNPPAYDFTGGKGVGAVSPGIGSGPFTGVFTNYDIFLALGQVFEDTGVRAYKGQAPNIIGNKTVLSAALQIHSVEARHASHLRQMRRARATNGGAALLVPNIKPWITGTAASSNDTGVAAADPNYGAGTSATYPAENNTTQGGVNIMSLSAVSGTTSLSVSTEAFDEPLDATTIVGLVSIFGVK